MSAYNSCATYTTLQTPPQNSKLMAPSSVMPPSFSLPPHANRPLPPADQPLLPSNQPPASILQSLPITNTNNNVFDWSCSIKKDEAIAWTNCVRQSITRLEACKFSNVRMTIGSQKYSDKDNDDEQSNLSAFLGPNLWEKSCGTDFKLEYMDLDEFLVENGIPTDPISDSLEIEPDQSSITSLDLKSSLVTPSPTSSVVEDNVGFSDNDSLSSVQPSSEIKEEPENQFFPEDDDDDDVDEDDDDDDLEYIIEADGTQESKKPGCSKAPGEKGFNPAKRRFTSDELKPQPLVKKSRKVFVPDEHKDDKYWARRKKNNVAAKRSRDARRVKENQIALRANFLENENQILKAKLEKVLKDYSVIKKEKETLTSENLYLQKQLNKFNL